MNTNNSTLIISDMEYTGIKTNIINNFLNPFYKFTTVNIKKTIIGDIIKRSWFPVEYGEKTDTLYFYLDDGITISVDVVWEHHDGRYTLKAFI